MRELRVEEVAAERKGAIKIGPFGSALPRSAMVEDGMKVYGQENLIGRDWLLGERRVSEDTFHSLRTCELEPGDVVIGMMGSLGHCEVFPADAEPGLMDSHLLRIQVDPKTMIPEYLRLVLLSEDSARQIDQLSHGTIMAGLSSKVVKRIRFTVPPLEEQRRIAEILDTIDETIQATERVIAKLRAVWTGAIDEMLRPALTPDAAPRSWSRGTVGDFLHLQRGFDITKDAQRSGTVPVVSSSGIASYHDEARVKGPGVVTGRKGKLGDAYFIPVDFWPHDTTLWVTDFKGSDPRFIALFLRSLRLHRLDAATSVPTLNRNVVHPLRAAIPPLDEQRQIIDTNDEYEVRAQTEIRVLKKLTAVRSGLAADLLSGRVRTVAA